jgi:hypothetical protein
MYTSTSASTGILKSAAASDAGALLIIDVVGGKLSEGIQSILPTKLGSISVAVMR